MALSDDPRRVLAAVMTGSGGTARPAEVQIAIEKARKT